jgi:hypothetical protein
MNPHRPSLRTVYIYPNLYIVVVGMGHIASRGLCLSVNYAAEYRSGLGISTRYAIGRKTNEEALLGQSLRH